MGEIILGIGLVVFLSHFFVAIFERTRLPDVLLLTILGILLGPVFHLATPEKFGVVGSVLSTVALILILFESGTELEPDVMKRVLRPTLRLTLATFVVTIATAMLIGYYLLGLSLAVSAMMGTVLGGTSATVVIALVKSLKMKNEGGTILVLESALGDVLCIVLLVALVDAARSGSLSVGRMTGEILASFVMAAVLGVIGGVIWLLLLNAVRQFPNSAFTTLAWAFILYGITESMHFSGAIAVVAFGATLTNHERMNLKALKPLRDRHFGEISESDRVFYGEILFLLKTFFFVYLGLSLRLSNLRLFGLAGLFVAVIYLLRPFIVKLTVPRGDGGWESDALMSVMIPKGLVSAVLAAIPVAANIEGAKTLRDFTYFAVPLSILVTALLVLLLQKPPLVSLYRRLYGGAATEIRAN